MSVFEADDLFDKLATLAQQEKLMDRGILANKVLRKVCHFPSRYAFSFNASREITRIRERLDDIAKDRRDFGSSLLGRSHDADQWSAMRRRYESHSFVQDKDVIGRDQDRNAIIDMLLLDESVGEENVSFITVVGMGGLGKTTLAQLVYNDERVKREFPMRWWFCVSDDQFHLKAIVCGILESATKQKRDEDLSMELLLSRLRQVIDGNKYLLVLDDVWNEDREKWLQLRCLLTEGRKGSKIIVTTRSERAGKIIVSNNLKMMHSLKELSEEDSWRLFEKMAFGERLEMRDAKLVEIGKEIVKKCASVPLAIRVVGSLLYGQVERKWLSFKDNDLANITHRDNQNPVIDILKLSYYRLEPHLRSCFSYCAMFPKDYRIQKSTLISLWMAHGFIPLPSYGPNVEEVGEDYVMILLERCFFQDVSRGINDEIISFTIHDFMHDIAKEAAGSDIMVASSPSSQIDEKTRHFSWDWTFKIRSIVHCLDEMKGIRTLFSLSNFLRNIDGTLLSNLRCLRVLHLRGSCFKRFPSKIDKLLHLRYLDLSFNQELELLPEPITMLHDLQTLNLAECVQLKRLPRELRKLINLRCLDIQGCIRISHMPPGMNNLTYLHMLPLFVVGRVSYGHGFRKVCVGQLEELGALTNLKGSLKIMVRKNSRFDGVKIKEAQCVRSIMHLEEMHIEWDKESDHEGDHSDDDVEAMLEGLQPHHNLVKFRICKYSGVRFPSWALLTNVGTTQSNLVKIYLISCKRLQQLPSLSRLPCLKVLELRNLSKLEYVESTNSGDHGGIDAVESSGGLMLAAAAAEAEDPSSFFPSLESLMLLELPKLKGWWRSSSLSSLSSSSSSSSSSDVQIEESTEDLNGDHNNHSSNEEQQSCSYLFPRLSHLIVEGCPNLTFIPHCPHFKNLTMFKFNEALEPIIVGSRRKVRAAPSSSLNSQLETQHHVPRLKRVEIDNVGYLNNLPVQSFQSLEDLTCTNLKCLFQVLKHLTALESLTFSRLPESEQNEIDLPWESLNQSLRSLTFCDLPKLVDLPTGIQNLTALQFLSIQSCPSLRALPDWISCV